jgi:hypothetical protein
MKSLKCGAGERWRKISWTDHVRNEEVLLRVEEQRNILHEISKKGKAIPLQALTGPEGSRRLRLPDLMTIGT